MTKGNILVVDDEPDICNLVKEILEDEGYDVNLAGNGEEANIQREKIKPDLILLDIWMPDIDGISLLKQWNESGDLDSLVIMMSGHGTVETAVEATRLGAYDFLEKPLSLAKLILTVKHALERNKLQSENLRLRQYSQRSVDLIGKSKPIFKLKEQIERIASHNTPVLIIGESGTDKELVARYLHSQSENKDGPFVSVSVSGLADNGPGIELFGKDSDSASYMGYLQKAEGGTLFLKDIADMDITTQAKFLSAIESQSFTRIDGIQPIALDTRIIAATRYSLDEKVTLGEFRDDLFLQLNIIPLKIPPLREHFEDVPELLDYYVNYFVEQDGLNYRHFSTAAQNRLRTYSWPGNIRELKNMIQRMLILGSNDSIELEEVETSLGEQPSTRYSDDLYNFNMPLREARERFEKAYLEYQLKQANGSVSKIAKAVGMERTHLYRKLKSLGIDIKS
jgi:two-component system, NtrC family, nitrogen regulation response regulator NtrX